jgi:alkylhydroperoxidase/carboxymuconolactone decarboxylase family protein YurZ
MSSTRPWRDTLGAHDPAALERVTALLSHASRVEHLDAKTTELVTVAAALAVRAPANVRPHVTKAVEHGATPGELVDTLVLAATIGGIATPVDGLNLYAELGL